MLIFTFIINIWFWEEVERASYLGNSTGYFHPVPISTKVIIIAIQNGSLDHSQADVKRLYIKLDVIKFDVSLWQGENGPPGPHGPTGEDGPRVSAFLNHLKNKNDHFHHFTGSAVWITIFTSSSFSGRRWRDWTKRTCWWERKCVLFSFFSFF